MLRSGKRERVPERDCQAAFRVVKVVGHVHAPQEAEHDEAYCCNAAIEYHSSGDVAPGERHCDGKLRLVVTNSMVSYGRE